MQDVFGDPLVGIGVEVFVDPIDDAAARQLDVLRENVIRKKLIVLLQADVGLRGPVQQIGEGEQCLRGCIGPRWAVPGALIVRGEAEARAAAFGCSRSVFAGEALRIEELRPGDGVAGDAGVYILPGDVADEFAHAGELKHGSGIDKFLLFADAGVG